jgi:hypothetical protein
LSIIPHPQITPFFVINTTHRMQATHVTFAIKNNKLAPRLHLSSSSKQHTKCKQYM